MMPVILIVWVDSVDYAPTIINNNITASNASKGSLKSEIIFITIYEYDW